VYTHVVAVERDEFANQEPTGKTWWGALSYCGSLQLAHKALAEAQKSRWNLKAIILPIDA
jgi:hypothetical protein